MTLCKRRIGTLFAILCVALILCCTLAICLPHSHSEYDLDCAICAASKLSGDGILSLVLILSILIALGSESIGASSITAFPSAREGTPVWLKDKLSN